MAFSKKSVSFFSHRITPQGGGEKLCYTVTSITHAQDRCHPRNPCENGGQCIIETSAPDGFGCLCEDGFVGETCSSGIYS